VLIVILAGNLSTNKYMITGMGVHLLFVGGFSMFSIFVVKNRICDPVIPAKAGIHTFGTMFYL